MQLCMRRVVTPISIRARTFPHSVSATPFSRNYHDFRRWLPRSPPNPKGAIVLSRRWMRSSKFWRSPRSPVCFHQLRQLSVPPVPSSRLLGYIPSYSATMSFQFTFIQDTVANKQDYVELGKSCGHVCQALDRGLNGRPPDELSQSVLEAIGQLTS